MPDAPHRLTWIDGLRCYAAFAVVVLHLAGPLLGQSDIANHSLLSAGHLSMALVSWCVPIFVMVSGAMNLVGGTTPSQFYRKRLIWLSRTACWVAFFIGMRFLYEPGLTISVVARDLWRGAPYFHLWFLFMLLGLYAVTPLLSRLGQQHRTILASVVLILSTWITSTQPNAMTILQNNILTLFLPFMGYYILGHELMTRPLTRRIRVAGLLLTAVGLGILVICPAHAGSQTVPGTVPVPFLLYIYTAFSLPVVLMSIGVFLLARGFTYAQAGAATTPSQSGRPSYLSRMAPLTFGVFVIHPIYIRLLTTFQPNLPLPPLAVIWIYAVIIFTLSLITAWALSRLPGVRRLIL